MMRRITSGSKDSSQKVFHLLFSLLLFSNLAEDVLSSTTSNVVTNNHAAGKSSNTRITKLINRRSRLLQTTEDDNTSFEYEASTDVSFFLNLAYDAADMREADDDTTTKVDIYYNGRHAFVENDDGNQTNISFAGLSLGSVQVMADDQLYNIYRHAFYELGMDAESDVEGDFDGHPVEEYGNTLVMDLFELNSTRTETVGALIINVWMAIAHEFQNLQKECRSGDSDMDVKMNRALDRAAALWIGADQVRGDNIHGHLLYNLAEQAGELFDQDNGETWVNAQLMDIINSIQLDIQNNICGQDGGYEQVRVKINKALSYMTIPLVQMLIHHIIQVENEGGSDMVELYALSLAPRVHLCAPEKYEQMLELMVFGSLFSEDQQKALQLVQSIYSCLDVTCQDVGVYLNNQAYACQDDDGDNNKITKLAGYTPATNVHVKSYIDRDILLMEVLMFYSAYETALDVYEYGAYSDVTLSQLATNKYSAFPSEQYQLFNSYYGTTAFDFADNGIRNVLSLSPPFNSASIAQRSAVVIGLLQSTVMYLAMLAQLESAVLGCDPTSGDFSEVLQYWDEGAAFYIGSLEGSDSGGYEDKGRLLYGLAKQFCDSFGTCEPDDAAVNKVLIQALSFGSEALSNGQCDEARTVLRTSIQPALYIPLIQGTLVYTQLCSSIDQGDDNQDCVGWKYAFSRGLLPMLDQVWPTSAESLNDITEFQLTAPQSSGQFSDVVGYIREGLSHMSTDCRDIGQIGTAGGLCPDDFGQPTNGQTGTTTNGPGDVTTVPVSAPTQPVPTPNYNEYDHPPTVATDLAWGRYSFTNLDTAEKDSDFSLDVRDMRQATQSSEASDVYLNGRNALDGLFDKPTTTSLSAFSKNAYLFMNEDPMYNFFRFALYEQSTFENVDSSEETWPFADMVVKLALSPDNGNDAQLAAEAAVVMNSWMMIVHRLYQASTECKDQINPFRLIDSAVALWIGREQGQGEYNSGWMMYSIAQRAEQLYGVQDGGEAKVNADLMAAFNAAKVLSEFCPSQSNAFLEMRFLVNDIVKLLSKPILQNLLYYISQDDLDYTELYALAIIPQAVSCKTSTYLGLKSALVDSFSRDKSMTDEVYDQFGFFLDCLGFTCEDLGDTSNANSNLRNIVLNICNKIGTTGDGTSGMRLAGYEAGSDVKQEARIDLDIRQIDIFMRTSSYEAAADLYIYGRNSKNSPRTLLSNKFLATTEERQKIIGVPFAEYSSYFSDGNYADTIVMSALRQQGKFVDASRDQLAEAVLVGLQSMVSYMAVLWKVYSAIDLCLKGQDEAAAELDRAVAWLVGSLEGPDFGGYSDNGGVLMYALAKGICEEFDTCEGSGDASVNEKLIMSLSDMRNELVASDCDEAASIVSQKIYTLMPIPLIQSSIYYAAQNEVLQSKATAGSLAAGYVVSNAVIPLVKAVNSESATTIASNMEFNIYARPVQDGASAVADAFAHVVRAIGIDCNDVGTLSSKSLGVCTSSQSGVGNQIDTGGQSGTGGSGGTIEEIVVPPVAPLPDTPTNLGENLYVTTTYVQDRANIALDIQSMDQSMANGHISVAKLIYDEGENSNIYDQNGISIGQRSLGGFSTNSTKEMVDESLFNIFVYALQDFNGLYLGKDAKLYADTIVQETFQRASSSRRRNSESSASLKSLPSEAAVALNLWMYLAHKLFGTLQICKKGEMTGTKGAQAIDEAVAYWIGDGQIAGDSERGHLLYALAEKMGEEFRIDVSGQSRTNTNILRLFQQAKMELSFPDACKNDPDTFRRLRGIVNKIVSQMTIPLIQGLIHNLRLNDSDRVRVYAHAFVPLVASCSRSKFDYLRDRLLFDTQYNIVEVEDIIDTIRSTFPCFEIQCDDIGMHSTELEASCVDPPTLTPLTGYKPASNVKEYAQIDLDILEIDILMIMEAYGAAEELYTYGKHTDVDSGPVISLANLATASGRSVVPEFDSYVRYYDGDNKYADTMIRLAFGTSADASSSDLAAANNQLGEEYGVTERRLMVVRGCQYGILFMAALQGFYEAASECDSGAAQGTSTESWDRAAAFLIGHMDGTDHEGSSEGRLFFSLARKECRNFGTCSNEETGEISVVERIEELLYSGRGALLSGSCRELLKAAREIQQLLLVPLIQGTLAQSVAISAKNVPFTPNEAQVEAFVYASTILPLIEDVDRGAAETIRNNLEVLGKPLPDGISSLFSAFAKVYSGLGIKCEYIGTINGMDACKGFAGSASRNKWLIVGVVIGFLAVVACLACLFLRRKVANRKSENNPTFVTANGELNHTEDLLRKSNVSLKKDSSSFPVNEEHVAILSDSGSDSEKGQERTGDVV